MAEIIIKVGANGPDPAYQDGDPLEAFNDRRIAWCHAQHICHYGNAGFKRNGLRPSTSLTHALLLETYQYKYMRVSKAEVERLEIASGKKELFSNQPNELGQSIHVQDFLNRRLSSERHLIFGVTGREFWFGGEADRSVPAVDRVWIEIESKTHLRKADHNLWPLSEKEKRIHLALRCDDFNEETATKHIEPVVERLIEQHGRHTYEKEIIVKKRKHVRHWRDLDLGSLKVEDIEDRNKAIDSRRDRLHLVGNVLISKVR